MLSALFYGHFDNRANPLKSSLCPTCLTEKQMNQKTMPVVELTAEDLPAYCPNPAMPLWSSHPRVFLDFDHHGEAKCPYCGTGYRLAAGTVLKHH
jgi:uncharacterized Zn-finger protein